MLLKYENLWKFPLGGWVDAETYKWLYSVTHFHSWNDAQLLVFANYLTFIIVDQINLYYAFIYIFILLKNIKILPNIGLQFIQRNNEIFHKSNNHLEEWALTYLLSLNIKNQLLPSKLTISIVWLCKYICAISPLGSVTQSVSTISKYYHAITDNTFVKSRYDWWFNISLNYLSGNISYRYCIVNFSQLIKNVDVAQLWLATFSFQKFPVGLHEVSNF